MNIITASIKDILTPDQLRQAKEIRGGALCNILPENEDFGIRALPTEAVFPCHITSLLILKKDVDGHKDLLLSGNIEHATSVGGEIRCELLSP
jgi:hypothetical protein